MIPVMGSKPQTAHDDTREFIRGLEMTARKILTKANKRRMDELRRQQRKSKRMGAGADADATKKFVINVPPGVEDWGDQLASRTMEIASTGMTVAVRATREPSRHRSLDVMDEAGANFPSLGCSDSPGIDLTGAGGKGSSTERKLPRITRRTGTISMGGESTPPTPGGDRSRAAGDTGGAAGNGANSGKPVRVTAPAAKISDRLMESPLFSASMVELTQPPRRANAGASDPLSSGGGEDGEAPGGIANLRVVNASKIIGSHRGGQSFGSHPTSRRRSAKGAQLEAQGATSWSSDDLRVKYRAEREREEAYQAFRLEEQVAEALEQDYGQAVAVPEVGRHPLYVSYYAQLEWENTRCLLRASARNKMKRFITDVHTLWLTNLSHLPEFRQLATGGLAHMAEPIAGGFHGGDGNVANRPEPAPLRRGLDDGRDSTAIAASQSQIQSVRPERAFRGAIFYSSTSEPLPRQGLSDVAGGGGNGKSRDKGLRVGSPSAISNDRQDDECGADGGESPELPPPLMPLPTLAVLLYEQQRLAPASGSGPRISLGGTQGKSGGGGGGGVGGRRRSVSGGGQASAGAASLLDLRLRMLRVSRFAPLPPLLKARPNITECEASSRRDDHEVSQLIDGARNPELPHLLLSDESHATTESAMESQHPPPPPPTPAREATWMISSYQPYDGSQTRVFVGDAAVNKVVEEALSAFDPLATRGKDVREGEGDRLLVLRRGVRVPVLERDGRIIRSVLAVVEVFVPFCRSSSGTSATSAPRGLSGGGDKAKHTPVAASVFAANNSTLEIAAYPIFACGPGRRHSHRQRVVLTAESLWQRRRCLNPNATLFDKPPLEPTDWLTRDIEYLEAPGTEKEDGAGVVHAGGNGLGWEPKIPVHGDCRGGRRGVAHKALEDIVKMVTFGSPGGEDAGVPPDASREIPLLLLPSLSFGPEGPTAAPETTESSDTAAIAVSGGAARVANESKAEVLLSLVRLGDSGRGREPAIAVDGIESSSMLEDIDGAREKSWEKDADSVESLSMRICGRRGHTREVPGTCRVGKMGVTFTYLQAEERTQAVASFFRDTSISSTDSVMVVTTLALDTPMLTPVVTAWETFPTEPEPAPDEDVLGIVPRMMIPPGVILQERVVSDIDGLTASDVLILTGAEKDVDYLPLNLVGTRGGESNLAGATAVATAAREAEKRGVRHRRDWADVDAQGFRRCAVYRLLEPDGHMETLGFGVTKRAALPNTAVVCGRSTFHSEQRCTEQLCRQRTAKDYSDVSANRDHRGPGDPGSYSVSCKHERMATLSRTGLERYNAEMARIAKEKERQAKAAALQAKVEIGQAQLAYRRAKEDAVARSLARKEDARNLKVSAGADRSRHKWELRVQDSYVLETRGSWEMRKDSGGSVFYSCFTEEALPHPFSWDPPDCWDALHPSLSSISENKDAQGDERAPHASDVGTNGELSSLGLVGTEITDGKDANETALRPRLYTEEEKISLAVTRVAENKKLLEALAWRLGIPVADIRPDGREPALAREFDGASAIEEEGSGRGHEDDEEIDENREAIELGTFDENSDSDGERGDARGPAGTLPQDHTDLRRIRVAERRRKIKDEEGFGYKQPRKSGVPWLSLGESSPREMPSQLPKGVPAAESLEGQLGGLGWRRLARENLRENFLERVTNPRMQGPRQEAVNTGPKPRPMVAIDSTKATKRSEDFSVPVEAMFVADVVEEHARVLAEAERRMKREELLDGDDALTEFDAAKFAANGPQEFTTMERRLMALAEADGRGKAEVQEEEAKGKAVIAAKTGNLSELEGLLQEDVPIDTKDSNGNTLLLLAAQQGNKRIAKFLLRKGATMNHQNMDGNSVLHFCYSTGRQDMAEYLKSKGADDSLLNSEGLTCYEGLQAQRLDGI